MWGEKAKVIKNDNQIYEIKTLKRIEKGEQKTLIYISPME
jgi:hypothetical protein